MCIHPIVTWYDQFWGPQCCSLDIAKKEEGEGKVEMMDEGCNLLGGG